MEKRKQAIESDLKYRWKQYEGSWATDEGVSDPDIQILVLHHLQRDHDQLDVDIAEKRLALYDLQEG